MVKGFAAAMLAVVMAASSAGEAAAAGVSKAQIAQSLSAKGYAVRDFKANMLRVDVGEHAVLVGVDGSDADVSYITYLNDVRLGEGGHKLRIAAKLRMAGHQVPRRLVAPKLAERRR